MGIDFGDGLEYVGGSGVASTSYGVVVGTLLSGIHACYSFRKKLVHRALNIPHVTQKPMKQQKSNPESFDSSLKLVTM